MNDRWGRRLFVASAVVLLLLGAVHSVSLIEKPAPANDTEKQLLDLMNNYKFSLMGSIRTMNDLMLGFSISFMAGAIAVGLLDLSLRREAATQAVGAHTEQQRPPGPVLRRINFPPRSQKYPLKRTNTKLNIGD